MLDLVIEQLLRAVRDPVPQKKCSNFPFLMGQGVWLDSEKLGPDDEVREVLKHGTLSIGFIGLAETPEGPARRPPRRERGGAEPGPGDRRLHAQVCWTSVSQEHKLNYTLLATPAGGPVAAGSCAWTAKSSASSPA